MSQARGGGDRAGKGPGDQISTSKDRAQVRIQKEAMEGGGGTYSIAGPLTHSVPQSSTFAALCCDFLICKMGI